MAISFEKDPSVKTDKASTVFDTPPAIEEILVEGYARMSPAEKLKRVCALNRLAAEMAAASIRNRYGPNLPESELNLRLASLRLDRDTMIRVFDWDPEVEGY
jgi:hypothetical protein